MSSPIILAMTNGGSVDETDYVGLLAEATAHLDLGINPDGSWDEVMTRIRSIGKVSEQIYHKTTTSLAIIAPHRSRVSAVTDASFKVREELHSNVLSLNRAADMPLIAKKATWYGGAL